MRKIWLWTLCLTILATKGFTQSETYSRVRVICGENREVFLRDARILQGRFNKSGVFTGEIEASGIPTLEKQGFPVEVIVPDISSYYRERNLNLKKAEKNIEYFCGESATFETPQRFAHGSMGGYYTFDEVVACLDTMRVHFPNLISAKLQIGSSLESRPIWMVKISDNPDVAETETRILFTSLHHSQEPAGMQQLIFFMYWLLENYQHNPEVRYMVEHLEIFFIPAINPDGYVYNQSQNPGGGGTWRKNRRPNGLFNGVDLNRNYDYAFGYNEIGSSSIGAHPWYRGTSAFSEPETQAVKTFLETHNIQLDLNWHSYGNYIIYPWNYETLLTPDSMLFEQYARYMTINSHYRYGTCDQTYGYNSNGDADDWGYGATLTKNKIISLTAEIGSSADGFWPQASSINDLCSRSAEMNLRFTRLALPWAQVSDNSPAFISDPSGNIPFEVYCLGINAPASFSVTLTPLSGPVASTGPAQVFSSMNTLERRYGSISYSLSPAALPGEEVRLVLGISNGEFAWNDTLVKTVAVPDTVFYDPAETWSCWNNNGWGTTNAGLGSPPSCFADSPGDNYGFLQSKYIETNQNIDLTQANRAELRFNARWETEKSYDWVQLLISTDNGASWSPLCGKYSSFGTDDQEEGEPVYDGYFSQWLTEKISLDAYTGNLIKLRFEFHSDQTHNYDGFYLDDILVVKYLNTLDLPDHLPAGETLIYPNPSSSALWVSPKKKPAPGSTFGIYDLTGRLIMQIPVSFPGPVNIKTDCLPQGSYLLCIEYDERVREHLRFSIIR